MKPHPGTPIDAAISVVQSAAEFAKAIDRSPQFVSQLRSGGRQVPAELCPLIELATGGKVRCEELRPDVNWAVLRTPTPQAQGE